MPDPETPHPSIPPAEPVTLSLAPPKPDTLTLKDQYDFALRHFLFVADQRLKIFNFYIILAAASAGVTVNALKEGESTPEVLAFLGCFHILVVIVFFIIERRNILFIGISSSILKAIEALPDFPAVVRIFSHDDRQTKTFWQRSQTYRTAFYLAYMAQFTLGVGTSYRAVFGSPPESVRAGRSSKWSSAAPENVSAKKPMITPSKPQDDPVSTDEPASDTASTIKEEIFIMNRVIENR